LNRKATGMAQLNLVQQCGALLPSSARPRSVRACAANISSKSAKRIRLKENMICCNLDAGSGIEGYHFDFYVLSAAPVEVIHSALEGMVPMSHILGTEFKYTASGEIDSITRATAGYGQGRGAEFNC